MLHVHLNNSTDDCKQWVTGVLHVHRAFQEEIQYECLFSGALVSKVAKELASFVFGQVINKDGWGEAYVCSSVIYRGGQTALSAKISPVQLHALKSSYNWPSIGLTSTLLQLKMKQMTFSRSNTCAPLCLVVYSYQERQKFLLQKAQSKYTYATRLMINIEKSLL